MHVQHEALMVVDCVIDDGVLCLVRLFNKRYQIVADLKSLLDRLEGHFSGIIFLRQPNATTFDGHQSAPW